MSSTSFPWQRVLIKISGEALATPCAPHMSARRESTNVGIHAHMLNKVAHDIATVHRMGIDVAVVVGGGNFFRGVKGSQNSILDQITSDSIGMLATIMNGLALSHMLKENIGVPCSVFSAVPIHMCDTYTPHKALEALSQRRVVLGVAGTGNPYFTTDSAAVLRACELRCDAVLKATKVSGIFDCDPQKYENAVHISRATYKQVLQKNLDIMDRTAIIMAQEQHMPILICSLYEPNTFVQVIEQTIPYSIISHTVDPAA